MASLATLRTLIVLVTFFSVTFTIYGLAYTETPSLFSEGVTGTNPNQATGTNPVYLLKTQWNNTATLNITASFSSNDTDLTGWTWTEWSICKEQYTDDYYFLIESYDDMGIFGKWGREDFDWYFSNGTVASERTMVNKINVWLGYESHIVMSLHVLDDLYRGPGVGDPPVYGPPDIGDLNFTLTNSKGSMNVYLSFDEDVFYTPTNAIVNVFGQPNGGMSFSVTQDFDDRKTSINILTFIGSMFSMNPFGLPYPISLIMNMVWYGAMASLAYITFTVVRSLIPLLGGED